VWWTEALCVVTEVLCAVPEALCAVTEVVCAVPEALCAVTEVLCAVVEALCAVPEALCAVPEALCAVTEVLRRRCCHGSHATSVLDLEGFARGVLLGEGGVLWRGGRFKGLAESGRKECTFVPYSKFPICYKVTAERPLSWLCARGLCAEVAAQ
jgi:hypothetical protein